MLVNDISLQCKKVAQIFDDTRSYGVSLVYKNEKGIKKVFLESTDTHTVEKACLQR